MGIYECPYPYKRLLSEEEIVEWCAQSNQALPLLKILAVLFPLIERRLALSKGKSFASSQC